MEQPLAVSGPDRAVIRRRILRLAWPVVAEQLLTTLTQLVDMRMVAPLGAMAVAAVGLSVQPLWLLMGLFMGLATGVAALVARFTGAREAELARATAAQAAWLAGVLGLAAGGLVYWQAETIAWLMGAEPDLLPMAAGYIRTLGPGLALHFWAVVMGDGLRAAGDTRSPFAIAIVVNIINLALDWVLIYGRLGLPALGVYGAGVASSVSRVAGALLLLAVLLRGSGRLQLAPARLGRLDWSLIGRILRVGIPAAGERMASSAAYVLYARMIAALGTVAVAGHFVAVIAENVVWLIALGLDVAVGALVGQGLGARDPRAAEAAVGETVRLNLMVMWPFILLFAVWPQPYLALLEVQDPAVMAAAVTALRVAAVGVLPMSLAIVTFGALRGAGDTRLLLGIALSGGWIVRLGCAALFILMLDWGLAGAWLAAALDWGARLVLLWLRFRSGRWKEVRV